MYICIDTRKCFARGPKDSCKALSETYEEDGACPFCKPDSRVTDGKFYPMATKYDLVKKPQK